MSKDPTCIQPYLQNFNFFSYMNALSVTVGTLWIWVFSLNYGSVSYRKELCLIFSHFRRKGFLFGALPSVYLVISIPEIILLWLSPVISEVDSQLKKVLCVRKVHRFLKMFRSVIWFNLLPSSCNHLGVDHVDILCDYLTISHPVLTELLFFSRLKIKLLAFYSLIRLEPVPEP